MSSNIWSSAAPTFPDLIDLRWKNRLTGVAPDGRRRAARLSRRRTAPTGSRPTICSPATARSSTVRAIWASNSRARLFEERFLIADVEMKADFPSERWFWFEPPFHNGQSALLHKQPDDIYRIDLQLGPDADPEEEKQPRTRHPAHQGMVGDRPFEIDWVSVYTFQCRRLDRFVHGRVVFAGDSAHVVSPFGARGGNGGIQDVDNLAWKLAAVLKGEAPARLLESLQCGARPRRRREHPQFVAHNPLHVAEGRHRALFRDAVLDLAADHALRAQAGEFRPPVAALLA